MPTYESAYLKAAHKHSIFHYEELIKSAECGCFYCLAVFTPTDVTVWTDEDDKRGKTALCPKCGIDAVIPSLPGFPVNDKTFLKEMGRLFF